MDDIIVFSLKIVSINQLRVGQLPTCHDDMKDTGRPLFPHSVGGRAEESAVVHGVLRCVAQAALSTLTLGSLSRDPKHWLSGQ